MLKFIKLFIAAITVAFTLMSCSKKQANSAEVLVTDAPNIIFIIADDMGWDAFGNYPNINSRKANTPVLDSLAKTGITFNNYWVNPECSPTRAAMLTGKYGFRTGVGTAGATLQNNEYIIQKYITDKTNNLYSNAVIGKWHVSATNNLSAPENFGVQYYSGLFTGALPNYDNWTITSNGAQQNTTTYSTTQLIDQSATWVKNQTKPFFLWLALIAPHTPFHRPPVALITDKSLTDHQTTIDNNPLPYYLAAIEAMDKEIGRLITSLTAAQKENTVFIFMGDNGSPKQVAQFPYSALKSKSTLFQGGINTPLIISGKGVSRKNSLETALVQATDMFTTIAAIATSNLEKYQDGISLKPLLSNANATKRTYAYTEFFGNTVSANDGYAIRNENYKLIHLLNGTEYLYKLTIDPFEEDNLMASALSSEAQENLNQLRIIKSGL